MRLLLLVALGAVVACTPPSADTTAVSGASDAVPDSIRVNMAAFVDAIQARDSARVLAFFAEDSSVQAIEGGIMTRAQMARMIGGFYRSMRSIETAIEGPLQVTVLGPDAAVASGRYVDVFVDTTGARNEVRGIATWVWSKRGGPWQLFHLHATPDPAVPSR
ncbi:MAG: nuclear transport factor 2 family protein [Gemmatimonadaceae bacterium]